MGPFCNLKPCTQPVLWFWLQGNVSGVRCRVNGALSDHGLKSSTSHRNIRPMRLPVPSGRCEDLLGILSQKGHSPCSIAAPA